MPPLEETLDINKIDSQALTPTEEIPFVTPEPTPIPALPEIPTIEPTVKETETTAAVRRLQDLTGEVAGKEAFRAELEAEPELEAQRKTETELAGEIERLVAEGKAIPLQIQEEARGRGVTAAGIAPIQRARQREVTIQALGKEALLSATRGGRS